MDRRSAAVSSVTRPAVVLVLAFGAVLIYLPARLFGLVTRPEEIGVFQVAGIMICTAGGAIALWCVSTFAVIGRGTPAPFAPPRRLVTRGPYRMSRNPMYIGVGLFFLGVAVYFRSNLFLAYVVVFFIASHIFVVWYEEPALRRTFGAEYSTYCSRVGRWWPHL
jgi:protein-S-isoprenylcysteine O-methyltransferase Ste14